MHRSKLLFPALAGLIAACLVTGAKIAARPETIPGAPASRDSAAPISCKPRPPVAVELIHRGSGTWQVAIEALEASAGVQVRVGSGDVGHAGRILWTGGLRAGERRTFDAEVATGLAWAMCEIASPAGTTMRSVAQVPAAESRSRNLTAGESGRIVVDPTTGDGVFEYRGHVEPAR